MSSSNGLRQIMPYEEGSFTPTLYGVNTAGTNTYATRLGQYTRIGNIVHFTIEISLSAKDAAMDGAIRISRLPYTAKNSIPSNAFAMSTENVTIAVGFNYIAPILVKNENVIRLIHYRSASTASVVGNADIGATSFILISGFYFI